MAKLPLLDMQYKDEPSPGPAEETQVEEMDPEAEEMEMTYEQQRLATIRANEELLKSLGLVTNPALAPKPQHTAQSSRSGSAEVKRPAKRPRKDLPPVEGVRKSSRLAVLAKTEPQEKKMRKKRPKLERNQSSLTPLDGDGSSYETDTSTGSSAAGSSRKRKAVVLPPGEKIRIPVPRSVEYDDAAPEEEVDYTVVQPLPGRDKTGRLVFEGRWNGVFVPNLTPEEVLRRGAYGGNFFADTYSNVLKEPLSAERDIAELPESWLRPPSPLSTSSSKPFSITTHLTAPVRDPSVNRYAVPAGQALREWEKSGWIWKDDPRGWMQWYVRFYLGRRCVDDERQVQRWLNLAGPAGRFSRQLMKKIAQHPGSGGASLDNTAVDDDDVGRVMRQVCWQWGLVMDRDEWWTRIEVGAL